MEASVIFAIIKAHIWADHEIEIAFVGDAFLSNSRGEVSRDEGLIYVDKRLENSPEEALEVVAHELGHLVLHHRFFGPSSADLIRGSVFLDQGAPALSRYSPRSQEEAEASAFAAELIAPASDVFALWQQNVSVVVEELAQSFGCTKYLAQIQLAEGLYHHVVSAERPSKPNQDVTTREQEDAATSTGQPVLVDAGPGTGKTKTLVRRVEHLIRDKQVPPEHILVLTFSNEAAAELRERLESSLGEETSSRILASTFHGFGVQLLHAIGDRVGLDVEYSIMDEAAQEEALTELLGLVDCDAILDLRNLSGSAAEITGMISYLKDRLIGPEDLRKAIAEWTPESDDADVVSRCKALLDIFSLYEDTNRARNRVDFADLVLLPYRLLRDNDDLRERLRREFQWVLVDEYQDVSRATALFLQQVTGPDTPPWVVGDARQAIYRFRGAEPANVTRFADDFPGAVTFRLRDNYRSAPEIVEATNQLAALLENPAANLLTSPHWISRRDIRALGIPVRRTSANCDEAEREGVVAIVQEWLASGVPEEDIAVLARRNVDVRNVAVALNRRGIRAVTTGILTPEGAAGDLAAVISTVDQPLAIARVAYALNRQCPVDILNTAVADLLANEASVPCTIGRAAAAAIVADTAKLRDQLIGVRHSSDAWTTLTRFLFFETAYLRRLLQPADASAETAVDVDEVLSTIALAAGYRFSHRHESPRRSRLGFAERFRRILTSPAPGVLPPRKQQGAVRVMTCHAAKGLEFPCVVVAGQSVPQFPPKKEWLPPALRPEIDADLLQADALLFVGVSRAERAVVVSHARSASGNDRKPRRLPNLLESWLQRVPLPVERWEKPPFDIGNISVGRIWGGVPPEGVNMFALGAETCRLRVYVEEHLQIKFYARDRPLYPEFVRRVKTMLGNVVRRHLETGLPVTPAEVDQISDEVWPSDFLSDHAHISIYRPRARRWAQRFAEAFGRSQFAATALVEDSLVWTADSGASAELRLQLVTRFRDESGAQVLIALQTKGADASGRVLWSKLDDYKRLPFVLLQERDGDVRPIVFYGEDGELQPFRWHHRTAAAAIASETDKAKTYFQNIVDGEFDAHIDDWTCDRCSARIVCPWRMGAARRD